MSISTTNYITTAAGENGPLNDILSIIDAHTPNNPSPDTFGDPADVHAPNTTSNTTSSSNKTQSAHTYTVQVTQQSSHPVLSFVNHTSIYQQVFNPSYIALNAPVTGTTTSGLMVQVQNCSLQPGVCSKCNQSSGLMFTPCDIETGECLAITEPMPPLLDRVASSLSFELCSDPSIVQWDDVYYMFISKRGVFDHTSASVSPLELWMTTDITDKSQWKQSVKAFGLDDNRITGPATLLPMNVSAAASARNYLFYGGAGYISIANSCSITAWSGIGDTMDLPWLQPRPDYFDADGVETGPPPIQLRDGNYLMLYNGFRFAENETTRVYQAGWVVFNGSNPRVLVQRSDAPLISAIYDFYVKAIVRMPGSPAHHDSNNGTATLDQEHFRIYFSAADSSIGTAVISVTYAAMQQTAEPYLMIAVSVSVACAVFVAFMIALVWCKNNQKQPHLLEFVNAPEYISIMSEHIGSLDGRYPKDAHDIDAEQQSSRSASSPSYCSECGRSEHTRSPNDTSASDTLHVSQISFPMNDAVMGRESPQHR